MQSSDDFDACNEAVLFLAVLAFFSSPSGCSALTGGFSKVMMATPPSISRVAVGGAMLVKNEKEEARKMASRRSDCATEKTST